MLDGIATNGKGAGGKGSGSSGTGGYEGAEAGTALQLTLALLAKEAAGARKKSLQEVARQLSAAVTALEKAKEQRERKEREAKVNARLDVVLFIPCVIRYRGACWPRRSQEQPNVSSPRFFCCL